MKSSIESVREWKHSVNWRGLLLLLAVALPLLLLQLGGYPLKVGQQHLKNGALAIPVQVALLWERVEVEIVQSFSISDALTQSEMAAFGYTAAYRVGALIRFVALVLTVIAGFTLHTQLPTIQTIQLPSRVLLTSACGAVVVVQLLASQFSEPKVETSLLREPHFLWVFALFTIGISPVFEELYYRRFVQTSLDLLHIPWYATVVLVAVYFGANHSVALTVMLPLAVFGAVAGLAYYTTGKLWVPVALHMGLNVWSLLAKLIG